MLKIIHLQAVLPSYGNAPYRLHDAMLKNGIDSSMLAFNTPRVHTKNFYRFSGPKKLLKIKLYEILQKYIASQKKPNTHLFSYPFIIGNNVSNHPMIVNADVIYLHWINSGFLSLKNIRQILELGKPVVFFMHDMWTITGGCHYSFDCEGYKSTCEFCPLFKKDEKHTYASKEFKEKQALFSEFDNIYFIAPSKWSAECAKQSSLLINKPIVHIPNIIDEQLFKPFNKKIAKKILNINPEVKTIAFGCAAGIGNTIKGWSYLEKALNKIYLENKELPIEILIFGSEYDQATADALPYPVKFLGQLNDEISMVILDNATDLFVSPSLAESFGMTSLENIMCGTPVVVFNNGGTIDFVEHKINGYLAEYKSSDDLAAGIVFCLENELPIPAPEHFYVKKSIQKHLDFIKAIS